jgi:hypothetical protein
VEPQPIRTLGARSEWVVSNTPRPLYPRERHPVPVVEEAEWVSRPVWTGTENFALHRYSISDPSSPYRVVIPTVLSRLLPWLSRNRICQAEPPVHTVWAWQWTWCYYARADYGGKQYDLEILKIM